MENMSYETFILEKSEHLEKICENINKSNVGLFINIYPAYSVVADDGYNEADFLLQILIEPNIEKKLVLMFTKISGGKRVFIDKLDDEDAWKRAKIYCAKFGKNNYYGISDGKHVVVRAMDPSVRFEKTASLQDFAVLIKEIIAEERRIKDSEEFTQKLKEYFSELQPSVHSALINLLKDRAFRKDLIKFLEPIGMAPKDDEIPEEIINMISQQATYLLLDKIIFLSLINESREQLLPKLSKRGDRNYDEIFRKIDEPLPEPTSKINKEWTRKFWDGLEEKFKAIRFINYEPIFDPELSPLNRIALREDLNGCLVIRDVLAYLRGKKGLTKLFDGPLLSKIYEGLIPPDLRWRWGQIYTPPEVTRLIAEWAIRSPDEKVLDPACGTGRFLVSAYHKLSTLKREAGIKPSHQELLDQIYGIDINQFPAHLATMSLVSLDLTSVTDEVNIRVADFFHYQSYSQTKLGGEEERKIRLVGQTQIGRKGLAGQATLQTKETNKTIGPFDVILMNPPYTRQEALGKDYKENIVRNVALKIARKGAMKSKEIKMSKRAGYYVYFMTHGTNFLKDNGRFGMIVQNSWLDVDYGRDVQKFLLENYKIIAIIDCSKERFIKTADINTVIVFLEKCMEEERAKERDENPVRFVDLRKPLEWFENNYGFKELINLIENTMENYVDDDLRIIVKTQKQLWEEGLEEVEQKDGTKKLVYSGSKWGKYLRAPDIYFKILEKGQDLLIPLKEIAEVRFGIKTGANEFFYLPSKHFDIREDGEELVLINKKTGEEKFRIEREFWMHPVTRDEWSRIKDYVPNGDVWLDKKGKYFKSTQYADLFKIEKVLIGGYVIWIPNYVIKTPRECKSFIIYPKNFRNRVLFVHKNKQELKETNILKYIKYGEKQGIHKRPTCSSRQKWYELYKVKTDILSKRFIDKNFSFMVNPSNVMVGDTFFCISLKNQNFIEVIAGILNSTLYSFMVEIYGRTVMGQGVLLLYGPEIAPMLVLNPVRLTHEQIQKIERAFKTLSKRIPSIIFDEIGARNPEDVSLNRVKPDRRRLDEIIMGEILSLSKKEQLEIYRSIIRLVKERLERAKTGD